MLFEYDPKKNISNIQKHGVSLEEACTVFADPLLQIAPDTSQHREERYVAIGHSLAQNTLFVVYCYRYKTDSGEEIIRPISARPLTRREKRRLEEL